MSGVNKAILLGNLGRDPEIRHSQSGEKIVQLSVATSESWKDKLSGERKEKTEWHRVVIFNDRLADVAERYLRKGSSVYLEGSIQTRKWTDKDGAEKYSTEIVLSKFRGELVLLGGKGDGAEEEPQRQSYGDAKPSRGAQMLHEARASKDDLDDEIPF